MGPSAAWGFKFLVDDLAKSDKDENEGGMQIEYENQDPQIHRIFERDGCVLRRLLSPGIVARLVAIGERIHVQWMQEHAEEARKRNRSTALA